MDVQFAEPASEGYFSLSSTVLIAKEEHLVTQERL